MWNSGIFLWETFSVGKPTIFCQKHPRICNILYFQMKTYPIEPRAESSAAFELTPGRRTDENSKKHLKITKIRTE